MLNQLLLACDALHFPCRAAPDTQHLSYCACMIPMRSTAIFIVTKACLTSVPSAQVMHHISSVERRVVLLRELARVLRTGACALVTVWATAQEEPHKVAKWEPIHAQQQAQDTTSLRSLESSGGERSAVSRSGGVVGASACDAQRQQQQQQQNYFVPWHLPFHRAEAAAAAAQARDGDADQCALQDGAAFRPVLDKAKGTVVFKRFYHLFEREELRDLVLQVPCVSIIDVFYDKSNWCVIFERT